jgi:hypothetical protein
MNIQKFLDLSAGKWFSQRTNYLLNGKADKVDNSKADLTVELLAKDDFRVVELCQANKIDPNLSLGGAMQSWDNSVDWGKPKQQGASAIVLIPDPESDRTGKILRQGDTNIKGRYILGVDEALTLIIETDALYAEERQWFASDNLRLRTTIVKNSHGMEQTSFYSEIRKAPPKKE